MDSYNGLATNIPEPERTLTHWGWVTIRKKFSEISIEIHTFSLKEMYLKISSAKWRLFRLGSNIKLTSQWARWRHKSPASGLFTQLFIQVQIKENIKAPCHWPLCGEFTGDRWILRTKGQQRGKCFHLMTSSWGDKLGQVLFSKSVCRLLDVYFCFLYEIDGLVR